MNPRVAGLLLFLPVPIVLALFTRFPIGVIPSLALGTLLMVTHRLYARPAALRRAHERCLWCGAATRDGPRLLVAEPFGEAEWRACGEAHADSLRRVLGWAHRSARFLKVGIVGSLALFLPGALLADRGLLGALRPADAVAFFRLAVAVSVLPLGWWSTRSVPSHAAPLPSPFPVHIQALIGTVFVFWLFRVVGMLWLGLSIAYIVQRAGGS